MKPLLVGALALCIAGSLAGCVEPNVGMHGRNQDVVGEYRFGELKADIRGVTPLDVRAAAETVLRARGYVVTESTGTRERSRIIGRANVDGRAEGTTIEGSAGGGRTPATRVRVTVDTFESWGDEASSRFLLDAILARLGR